MLCFVVFQGMGQCRAEPEPIRSTELSCPGPDLCPLVIFGGGLV